MARLGDELVEKHYGLSIAITIGLAALVLVLTFGLDSLAEMPLLSLLFGS